MEYHCAGSANDPNFADAEAVLDDLAINLPDVVVIKHMKSPDVWDMWGQQLCRRMGFPEAQLAKGPIVWAAGRLVGDHVGLKSYSERVYGRCCQKDQRDLHMLAQENLRLCSTALNAQADREKERKQLSSQEAAAKEQAAGLAEMVKEKEAALGEAQKQWQTYTDAARVCLKRLDMGDVEKVLQAREIKPPLSLQKLAKFVVRVLWGDDDTMPTSQALLSPGAFDKLSHWLADAEAASPLFGKEHSQRQAVGALLARALLPMQREPGAEEKLKAAMAVPEAIGSPEGQLENALEAWCRGIYSLCNWTGLNQYRDDLAAQKVLLTQHAEAEARSAEISASVVSLGVMIQEASDPYDPEPTE